MNFYSVTQLISGIFSLFLGSFVVLQDVKNKVYRYYGLFCLSLSCWCICYFIWQIQPSEQNSIFWMRSLMAFASYIHPFFLHFVLCLTGLTYKKHTILNISYILSTIFFFVFISGLGFSSALKIKMSIKYWPDANLFTLIFVVLQILCVLYSLYCLYIANKQSPDKKTKNQLKYLLVVSSIAWAGGLTNWFLWFNIPIPPVGNPLIAIYVAVIAYSILKHQLLDINIVIKKSLIYSISVTILTTVYLLIIFLIESIFRDFAGYRSNFLTICILISFALVFQPLKNRIQNFIDKYFFHGSIDQIDEENIKLRGELQETEKLKAVATLAAGMAHEIKNPLTSIKTFTEYLPEKKNDPEFLDKFQSIVGTEVDRINYIVKQLLEFSGPSKLHPKETDINILLDETLNLLNNDLLKQDIKTVKHYAPLPLVKVDPSQIKQVFLNLFLNAMESIKKNGTITINTRVSASCQISIRIEDTGIGIDKDDIHHIFDPFFSKKDGGTGLGLSVVHGIIEKHNGKISVKSTPPRGTTFQIILNTK